MGRLASGFRPAGRAGIAPATKSTDSIGLQPSILPNKRVGQVDWCDPKFSGNQTILADSFDGELIRMASVGCR
jgi:hypothetical protein